MGANGIQGRETGGDGKMSKLIYYFAYGSNLHPLRLSERVSSARLVGPGWLSGYRLLFHKRGQDGSGKCNLLRTKEESDLVYGAIYTLDRTHKPLLDAFEGRGAGYIDRQIMVSSNTGISHCFTYLAQESHIDENTRPYHWYKKLVIQGARYLGFPTAYIASIEAVVSYNDQNISRCQAHDRLLKRIDQYQ